MKFDYILGNPPFGSTGGDTLHLKCIDKIYDLFNKKMIVIMPFGFVTKDTKSFKNYQIKFAPKLQYVKEISGDNFEGTAMPSAAIYEFTNEETKTTILEDISGNKTEKSDLTNVSQFTPYEEEIIKYLESQGSQLTINAGNVDKRKKELIGMTNDESYNYLLNKLINNCLSLKENLANLYSSGIICSRANGGMNGKYFSSQSGQVYNTYNEFEKYFIDKFKSTGYAVILHKSNKAAENCKIALQNSLLRFILYKTQLDQSMSINRVYKYVPAIDWEDERCLTDEGLLEMCGCSKDKAKEYAEYVKKYVEERDKEFENKKKRK